MLVFSAHALDRLALLYPRCREEPQILVKYSTPVPPGLVAGLIHRPIERCQDNYLATPDGRGLLVCAHKIVITILRMGQEAISILQKFLGLDVTPPVTHHRSSSSVPKDENGLRQTSMEILGGRVCGGAHGHLARILQTALETKDYEWRGAPNWTPSLLVFNTITDNRQSYYERKGALWYFRRTAVGERI